VYIDEYAMPKSGIGVLFWGMIGDSWQTTIVALNVTKAWIVHFYTIEAFVG
jgi:hypothetical protein